MGFKGVKKLITIFMEVLFMTGLVGCSPSQEDAEEKLKERYGNEFFVGGLTPVEGGYNALAYPVDNPMQLFKVHFNKKGEVSYDQYVEAIEADNNSEIIAEELSDMKEVVFVHGHRSGHMGNSEPDLEIVQLVREDMFTYKEYYDIYKTTWEGRDNFSLSFYIFICGGENYEEEFDQLKSASYKIIDNYKDYYDTDIWIHLNVFYIEQEDVNRPKEYYSQHSDIKSLHEEELEGWTNKQIDLGFGYDDSKIPEDYVKTKMEYNKKRKEME